MTIQRQRLNVSQPFFATSGKKFNYSKSYMFFLHNVKEKHKRQIVEIGGFSITSNLGMYLRIPIFHKKVSKPSCVKESSRQIS